MDEQEQEEFANNIVEAIESAISEYAIDEDIKDPIACINPYGLYAHMIDPRSENGHVFWCDMNEETAMTAVKVGEGENYHQYAVFKNNNLVGDIEVENLVAQEPEGMTALDFEEWFAEQYNK